MKLGHFGRFIIVFLRPLFCFLYPFRVIGRENIPGREPRRPMIFCANHISNLDPVFIYEAQKEHVYFMAKSDLFSSRLGEWFFLRQMGAFPVERGKGDTQALDNAVDILKSGKIMGIFPEGTRSRDGQLGRFKSGTSLIASRAGAVIVPIAIKAKDQKVRMFHRTNIIFGKPLTPEELELNNAERPNLHFATRAIMQKISELLEENR